MDDFLMLKRQDLVEMSIPIGIRNRVLAFNQYYTSHHGNIDLDSLKLQDILSDKSDLKITLNTLEKTNDSYTLED